MVLFVDVFSRECKQDYYLSKDRKSNEG